MSTITVRVKLMASLRRCLPPEAKNGTVALTFDAEASVATVLDRLGIAHGLVYLVMVNDVMESERARRLVDGDDLVIVPPVAGG